MFLVKDKRYGATNLVFNWIDPRADGYQGSVEADVGLDFDTEKLQWPRGEKAQPIAVGRSPDDPKLFKIFRNETERDDAGYDPVEGVPLVLGSWADYERLLPNPKEMAEQDYFEFLDQIDEAARYRRQHEQPPDQPDSNNRDDVARWIARQHFLVDSSIQEVWYFPTNAPDNEIRLLEKSDRSALNGQRIEPIAFGVDLEGADYRLMIAAVTSEQFEQIKQDVSVLPPGWTLNDAKNWKRGE